MPGFHFRLRFDLYVEELLRHPEQAGHHLVHREPGAQGFRGDVVALLAELFAVVADVPRLQVFHTVFVLRKGFEFGKLFLGLGLGFGRQLVQEAQHLVAAAGHLGGQ